MPTGNASSHLAAGALSQITVAGLNDLLSIAAADTCAHNLSNDYLWQYLSNEQIDLMSSYKMYSRVCCFKGIDERSFSLNTKAAPNLFLNQFELCKRLLQINLDLYCYITLTANTDTDFEIAVPKFLDRVQEIDELLPLRIVPLRIFDSFTPIASRMNDGFQDMLKGQYGAIEVWKKELLKRFSTEHLSLAITEIKLKNVQRQSSIRSK